MAPPPPMALTRALGRTLRKQDPPGLVRLLARAWTRRFDAMARYWIHHAPLRRGLTADTMAHYLHVLATAPVQLELDHRRVRVLAAPWTHVPLRACTGAECRILFHLVAGERTSVKQMPRVVRPDRRKCPFHLHVDRRTFQVRYTRCRYNSLLDGYVRRDALVRAFVRAAGALVLAPVPRPLRARHRRAVGAALATAVRAAAADVAFPTHPLRKALARVADATDAAAPSSSSTEENTAGPILVAAPPGAPPT